MQGRLTFFSPAEKVMKEAIPFTTASGHHYLYSSSKKQFLLSHPLLNYLINSSGNGNSWQKVWKKSLQNHEVDIPGTGKFESSEFQYYLKKFRFLSKEGFFKTAFQKNHDALISPDKINQNLARTKQIIFETTEDCNLDCLYCTYSKFYFNKSRERNKINTVDAIKLLDLIIDRKRINPDQELAISFYGGEPLKNFSFIEGIVNHVTTHKHNHLKIRYSLTSNGLLLRKHIGFLVKHNFDLAISLDGDEFANSFRVLKTNRKSSFNLVSRNIDMVREKFPEYFDKRVMFMTVRHNRNTLKSIYEYFSSRYGKTPMLSSITTNGIVDEFKEEFHKTFLEQSFPSSDNNCYVHELFTSHPVVAEITETFERFGDFVYRGPKKLLNPLKKNRDTRKYLPTATCSPFDLRLYMSADGGIYPCEHISRIFELGSVRENEVDIDSEKITDTYNNYFRMIKKLCNQCYLSDNCKECIFNTGIEKGFPSCEFFMTKNKFTSYLSGIFDSLEQDISLYARVRDEAFLAK